MQHAGDKDKPHMYVCAVHDSPNPNYHCHLRACRQSLNFTLLSQKRLKEKN